MSIGWVGLLPNARVWWWVVDASAGGRQTPTNQNVAYFSLSTVFRVVYLLWLFDCHLCGIFAQVFRAHAVSL